jgi:hypothetical protein
MSPTSWLILSTVDADRLGTAQPPPTTISPAV